MMDCFGPVLLSMPLLTGLSEGQGTEVSPSAAEPLQRSPLPVFLLSFLYVE